MCAERNGKNGNGKETGKNAFLSFPVPTNFDQRTSLAVGTPAQTPDVGPVAVGHHTEVVGVDTVVEDDLVHHVPHRRVHRRTKGTVVTR